MKFKSSPLARYRRAKNFNPPYFVLPTLCKIFVSKEVPNNLMYSYYLTGVCLIRGINVLFYTDHLCNDSEFEIWIYAENWFYWGTDKLSALSSTSLPSSFSWTCRTQRISHQTCQSCKSINTDLIKIHSNFGKPWFLLKTVLPIPRCLRGLLVVVEKSSMCVHTARKRLLEEVMTQ